MGKRGAASFVALRLFRFESRDARAELVELGLELLENFVERFGELRKSDFLSFFRGSCCGDAMGLQPALGGLLEDFGRKGGNRMAGGLSPDESSSLIGQSGGEISFAGAAAYGNDQFAFVFRAFGDF